MKRIVILGAGFGGIYAYLGLKKHLKKMTPNQNKFGSGQRVEIVLIDKKNYFLFVPMLHEVATGSLEPSSIIQPIRQAIDAKKVKFVEGLVKDINLDNQEINLTTGSDSIKLEYDYLVLSLGSTNNFFGTPGVEHAMILKDLQDAQKIKNTVISAFEQANTMADCETKDRLLNFVVIGGGPTGVELAGEMADLINDEIKKSYPDLYRNCHVHLIQSGDRLLPPVDKWFGEKTKKILKDMKVQLHFNTKVTEISSKGIVTNTGETIPSANIFWTAGVKAQEVSFTGDQVDKIIYDERSRRIKVNPTLSVENLNNVFVVGDQMYLGDMETGQPYPMRAQFAAREGTLAGQNIAKLISQGDSALLKSFHWQDQGFIVSLGKGQALAEVFGIKFSGWVAWWLYRTAYLFKLVGARAKFKTAYEWTINLFLPRDISKF
jgi:NADH:ubiquinone reductase (H+-translocating)